MGRSHSRYSNPVFDIQDVVTAQAKWAIRFIFTSTGSTRQGVTTEVVYFYRLRGGNIAEFWVLADVALLRGRDVALDRWGTLSGAFCTCRLA